MFRIYFFYFLSGAKSKKNQHVSTERPSSFIAVPPARSVRISSVAGMYIFISGIFTVYVYVTDPNAHIFLGRDQKIRPFCYICSPPPTSCFGPVD